jgi:hypothetical protein
MLLTILSASLALTFIAEQTGYREINHSPVEVTGAKIINPFFSLNIHHVEKAADINKVLIRKVSFFLHHEPLYRQLRFHLSLKLKSPTNFW